MSAGAEHHGKHPDGVGFGVWGRSAERGLVSRTGSGFGVWGQAVNAFPVFLQPLARAFHAKSHTVAADPDGGASGPLILTASRECIP